MLSSNWCANEGKKKNNNDLKVLDDYKANEMLGNCEKKWKSCEKICRQKFSTQPNVKLMEKSYRKAKTNCAFKWTIMIFFFTYSTRQIGIK
jgi:hypothetical protein